MASVSVLSASVGGLCGGGLGVLLFYRPVSSTRLINFRSTIQYHTIPYYT